MKDAVLTIRLPAETRRRIEEVALREGRSLSQAAERLIEEGLRSGAPGDGSSRVSEARAPHRTPLADALAGGLVPTLDDFREVRQEISDSILERVPRHGRRR